MLFENWGEAIMVRTSRVGPAKFWACARAELPKQQRVKLKSEILNRIDLVKIEKMLAF